MEKTSMQRKELFAGSPQRNITKKAFNLQNFKDQQCALGSPYAENHTRQTVRGFCNAELRFVLINDVVHGKNPAKIVESAETQTRGNLKCSLSDIRNQKLDFNRDV